MRSYMLVIHSTGDCCGHKVTRHCTLNTLSNEHCGLGLRWCNVLTSSALAPRYSVIAELRMNPIVALRGRQHGHTATLNSHLIRANKSKLLYTELNKVHMQYNRTALHGACGLACFHLCLDYHLCLACLQVDT